MKMEFILRNSKAQADTTVKIFADTEGRSAVNHVTIEVRDGQLIATATVPIAEILNAVEALKAQKWVSP